MGASLCLGHRPKSPTADSAAAKYIVNSSSSARPVPSWEQRRQQLDPADFCMRSVHGADRLKAPGSLAGRAEFVIDDCQDSRLLVLDWQQQATVDRCQRCVIILGPTAGSVSVRDCRDCVLVVVAAQFRMRDCHNCAVHLHCRAQPVIESSTRLRFACARVAWPQMPQQIDAAGLSVWSSQWWNIFDYTPLAGNFDIVTVPDADELQRLGQALDQVGAVNADDILPLTEGDHLSPGGSDGAMAVCCVMDKDEWPWRLFRLIRQHGARVRQTRRLRVPDAQFIPHIVGAPWRKSSPVFLVAVVFALPTDAELAKLRQRLRAEVAGTSSWVLHVSDDAQSAERDKQALFTRHEDA